MADDGKCYIKACTTPAQDLPFNLMANDQPVNIMLCEDHLLFAIGAYWEGYLKAIS